MASELDFRLLFEESPDVLLVLLPDAPRYTMVAATHSRWITTHTTPETIGRGLFEVFPDNPDDPTATGTHNLRASLERVLKTRRPDTMAVQKYDIRGQDGNFEVKYWSPKNLPVLSASGEVLYILHRVEDVTALVRANELGEELRGQTRAAEREVLQRSHELAAALRELRDANAKLAELDRAKTEFFSNVSHEFRTPLTLMLGPLEDELVERSAAQVPGQRARIETAHRNALRLLKLVNSLLDFSRIEAGRTQATFAPTELAALTRDLASVFRSATDKAAIDLVVDCPDLTEPVFVDHEMWEKIVFNLLSNALKHTFVGSIGVALRRSGEYVELRVSDTGVGIPEAELPHLFKRFQRVKGARSRSHEGSGIGLALVQELATLHGGAVRVESALERGSTFTVTIKAGQAHLPLGKMEAAPAAHSSGKRGAAYIEEALQWLPDEVSAGPARQPQPQAPSFRDGKTADSGPQARTNARPRILWADDNADMRRYVTDLLSQYYDVLAVPDGQAALEAARATVPDLVLSDVMMPRLDGFGLLDALRADERTRRLPIILLSARAGEEAAVGGLDAGADDYLVKPFSARELLARVRTHVELARQRRAWEKELEQRVTERTAELAEAVDALEAENSKRKMTERKLEAQLQRMNLLDHITRAIAERQDLHSIFQVVTRSVEESLPAAFCWIGLTDSEAEGLLDKTGLIYEPDASIGSWQLPKGAPIDLRSLVRAPLRADNQLLGVLLTGRREPDSFNSQDCEFLRQLSEHVALAARQAQLHQSLQAAYDELRLTQQAVLQQERLSALGQMASGIAHDINNAISPISLYVESLLESDPTLSARARQSLPIVLRAINDVAATLRRMREFYRAGEPQMKPRLVDVNPLVDQVIELTRARWSDMPQQRGAVIRVVKDLAHRLPPVSGIDSEIREALTNLIFNAVDAMPDGGTLALRTTAGPRGVCLEVADTGIGMDDEIRRRCLEPFFTTKGDRGTGLGLAMVYGVVQRHSADIEIVSAKSEGTTIKIIFPAVEVTTVAEVSESSVAPSGPLRVLLIDDDSLVLQSLRETLGAEGHTVVAVSDPREAISTFRLAQASNPFSVVITDLGMPYLDGRAVAKAVKEISPGTPVVLLTGWGQRSDGEKPLHIDHVLGKPPKLREIRAALAQYRSPPPSTGQ